MDTSGIVAQCYSRGERIADGAIHFFGVFGSVVAITVMLVLAAYDGDGVTILTLAIYGAGVVAVFTISAAYHLTPLSPAKRILRRFDHAAIFVKIAGTYTPFAAISIGGGWGAALLGSVWGIAAVGVPIKLFDWKKFERFSVALYLAQGWLVVIAIGPLVEALSTPELVLCAVGGVLYTIGVAFYLATRLPYNNAIWHGFVLAASACFYAAVLKALVLG